MNTNRPPCRCGKLAEHAADQGVPFTHDPVLGSYLLNLTTETVSNVFCPFCGGFESGPWTTDPPLCACGELERWADDPRQPVEWGTIGSGMFGLRCSGGKYSGLAIWFCPACGGRSRDVMALAALSNLYLIDRWTR